MTTFDEYFDRLNQSDGPNEWPEALHGIVELAQRADSAEVQLAVERLARGAHIMPFWYAKDLAQLAGGLAELGTDPVPLLDPLVRRACEVMEAAARLAVLHEAELPEINDNRTAKQAIARFAEAAAHHGVDADEAETLLQAHMSLDLLVEPVIKLAHRHDVRVALPHRERLAAAIEPVRDRYEMPSWLAGLLPVLDDEQLIVLDRGYAGTGRGYRVTIGGVADNYQLHTLLAATLINPDGLLPGTRPADFEIAAATDGKHEPSESLRGVWTMADAHGHWIWHEHSPADIRELDGVRVVVLDQQIREQTWDIGRVYPSLVPTVRLDGPMSASEAAEWLSRVKPADHVSVRRI